MDEPGCHLARRFMRLDRVQDFGHDALGVTLLQALSQKRSQIFIPEGFGNFRTMLSVGPHGCVDVGLNVLDVLARVQLLNDQLTKIKALD